MNDEKIYTDPALTLQTLAAKLGTNANKLSWFLNSVLYIGFNEYVNKFRLEAVAADLVNTPDPILEIAFNEGFGSKTAFNSAFLKYFGMSPGEYRKRHYSDSIIQ